MVRKISDLTVEEFTELLERTIIKVLESRHKPIYTHGNLPKELQTEKGKLMLDRGKRLGILESNGMPTSKATRYQLKEFADLASQVLGIKNKWSAFGGFWGINNMSQIKIIEASVDSLLAIRAVFPELGFDKNGYPKKPRGIKDFR